MVIVNNMMVVKLIARVLLVASVMVLVSGLMLGLLSNYSIFSVTFLTLMEIWAHPLAIILFTGLMHLIKPLPAYQIILLGIAFGIICSSIYVTITLRTEHYDSIPYEYIINGIRYGIVGGVMGLMYVLVFNHKTSTAH